MADPAERAKSEKNQIAFVILGIMWFFIWKKFIGKKFVIF